MFLDAVSAPQGGRDKATEEGEGLIHHLSISATGNPDSGVGESLILRTAASSRFLLRSDSSWIMNGLGLLH